jgi:hypothetical protein
MPDSQNPYLQPLKRHLASCQLNHLARVSGFLSRRSKKVTPANFLLTACLFALHGPCSLSSFAQLWARLHGRHLSKQAVHKRFNCAAVRLLQAVLQRVLADLVVRRSITSPLGHCFKRILVQDSTCLSLPTKLASLFPGPANQSARPQAALKIQATLDLLKNQWLDFQLTPFVVNDQKSSPTIVSALQRRDLVIRDLGYFVLEVFKLIETKGAFFLSRLRHDLMIFCPQSGSQLNWRELLRSGAGLWDAQVLLGNQKLPVRVVAVRLPKAVADERRRKAKANRDRRLKPSHEHMRLLDWNIFVTNVPSSLASANTLVELYALRWRIETIFKAWKSHWQLGLLTEVSAEQLLIVVLAKLIWICWFSTHWLDLTAKGFQISILKLAHWWSKFGTLLARGHENLQTIVDQLIYYCTYEKRKKRLNFLQRCARLG